ncbi:hypothetical protein BofuT4_P152910.1 [Botrytis cinerea T4]|uniref:Uncharacterized protein n=1 Tax=Botryotinia fuckeliana (strain T4) TaxID=999810 RepID=G2YVT1_BOTF4|nr:hypothetical protein BofuT4_P152910.1 [Botrytis cinerea T4]
MWNLCLQNSESPRILSKKRGYIILMQRILSKHHIYISESTETTNPFSRDPPLPKYRNSQISFINAPILFKRIW